MSDVKSESFCYSIELLSERYIYNCRWYLRIPRIYQL